MVLPKARLGISASVVVRSSNTHFIRRVARDSPNPLKNKALGSIRLGLVLADIHNFCYFTSVIILLPYHHIRSRRLQRFRISVSALTSHGLEDREP